MSTPLPTSPSSRHFKQASPTSPIYPEHRRTLLDEVKTWPEQKVSEWLTHLGLGRFGAKFVEQNISGVVLLDVDYETLKAMGIKTVGERVRLVAAIKSLRQECYLAASLAARTKTPLDTRLLTPTTSDGKHEGFNMTPPHETKISKSSETSAKSLLNRSNSFSRFLGRSDSKRSQRTNASSSNLQQPDVYSHAPSSPKTINQKRNSLEGGIMSMEKVKQTCVKVFGEDGQTRIVNVHTANEAKTIMAKVLHKFGIDESNADSYCIFVGSSTNGEARALSDTELIEICRSTDRPEKERLILRKRHMYPTHEEFKRKGTINARRQYQNNDDDSKPSSLYSWSQESSRPDYLSQRSSQVGSFRSQTNSSTNRTRRRFFGERPPSEIISSNLPSFFPNHNREVLETAGIKAQRLSTTRRNSAMSRMEPRNYRNSVLPELVSVLGVDLDKFLEEEEEGEEEEEEEDDSSTSEKDEIKSSDDPELEYEEKQNEETFIHPTAQPENVKLNRTSSLNNDINKSDESDNNNNSTTTTTNNSNSNSNINNSSRTSSSSNNNNNESNDNNSSSSSSNSDNDDKTDIAIPIIKEPVSTPKHLTPPTSWMKGSLIGRGTFGDVYLGLNPMNGELMAVKQVELPVENSATEEHKKSLVEALQREIELLKELQHDNIVQYLGSEIDSAYFSIFLEYVPGGSVAGLLASYGAFQETLVKSFVRQILKGLNYLHGKDIVHRDIKGANVLVDNKGGVKITDFGISKKVEEDIILQGQAASAAHRPSLQGSIYWMAPEVVKQTHYTRKADIWSLGCMVVEMFTGDHPFPEYSQMQAIFQIGSNASPNIPPNLSPDAQDFLKCTFNLNHEERPSAEELLSHPFLSEDPEVFIAP
ncbi:Pkinase-domain-containing protein [Backusella circina FSU 941]|nr:Pkinase-domain-containing protein [Backusella circina FSU 941]